ncbi:unnamed protein product [Amaranthus hypochondriacus]
MEISKEDFVLQKASIQSLICQNSWMKNESWTCFLKSCLKSNNPHALLHFGMMQYFARMKLEEGLIKIENAAKYESKEATYVLGLILLCSGDKNDVKKGMTLLTSIMKVLKGKGIVECRKKLRDFLHSIWLKNNLMSNNKPHITCPIQHQQKILSNWDVGYYYDEDCEDNIVCDFCKCAREIDFFYQMLPIVV